MTENVCSQTSNYSIEVDYHIKLTVNHSKFSAILRITVVTSSETNSNTLLANTGIFCHSRQKKNANKMCSESVSTSAIAKKRNLVLCFPNLFTYS